MSKAFEHMTLTDLFVLRQIAAERAVEESENAFKTDFAEDKALLWTDLAKAANNRLNKQLDAVLEAYSG